MLNISCIFSVLTLFSGFLLYFEVDYLEIGMIGLGLWGVTGALDIEAKKNNS